MSTWIGLFVFLVGLSLPILQWLKARRASAQGSRASAEGAHPSAEDPHELAEAQSALARIDRVAEELLREVEVTDASLAECEEAFDQFYRYLSKKNGTRDNRAFAEPDRTTFYLYAIRLAALQHPNHNAWPLQAPLRRMVLGALRRRMDESPDDWTRLAFVTAALLEEDVASAVRSVRALPPVLARVATEWVQESTVGYAPYNDVPSSRRCLQELDAEVTGPPPPERDALPRDRRWALSVAVYPSYGSDSRVGLAEPLAPAVCRRALEIWWEVDDSESAVGMLEWLLVSGHRAKLQRELGLIDTNELEPKHRLFLRENRVVLGKYSIAAWDLCRLVNVARMAYTAGYIDEATAWEYILAAAREVRRIYPSWRALGSDYILGSCYFSSDHTPDPVHRASVEWLQTSPASPWNRIPWEAFDRLPV